MNYSTETLFLRYNTWKQRLKDTHLTLGQLEPIYQQPIYQQPIYQLIGDLPEGLPSSILRVCQDENCVFNCALFIFE